MNILKEALKIRDKNKGMLCQNLLMKELKIDQSLASRLMMEVANYEKANEHLYPENSIIEKEIKSETKKIQVTVSLEIS